MTFSEQHFTLHWKIEQKPEGGFVARSDDPSEKIEGTTREELEANIREKVAALIGPEIAQQIPLDHSGEVRA